MPAFASRCLRPLIDDLVADATVQIKALLEKIERTPVPELISQVRLLCLRPATWRS